MLNVQALNKQTHFSLISPQSPGRKKSIKCSDKNLQWNLIRNGILLLPPQLPHINGVYSKLTWQHAQQMEHMGWGWWRHQRLKSQVKTLQDQLPQRLIILLVNLFPQQDISNSMNTIKSSLDTHEFLSHAKKKFQATSQMSGLTKGATYRYYVSAKDSSWTPTPPASPGSIAALPRPFLCDRWKQRTDPMPPLAS